LGPESAKDIEPLVKATEKLFDDLWRHTGIVLAGGDDLE
jgi:hypothetical protein